MVEQVEEIELELHLHPFDDLEVLPQGGIHVAVAGGHCRSRRLNSRFDPTGSRSWCRRSDLTIGEELFDLRVGGCGINLLIGITEFNLPAILAAMQIPPIGGLILNAGGINMKGNPIMYWVSIVLTGTTSFAGSGRLEFFLFPRSVFGKLYGGGRQRAVFPFPDSLRVAEKCAVIADRSRHQTHDGAGAYQARAASLRHYTICFGLTRFKNIWLTAQSA